MTKKAQFLELVKRYQEGTLTPEEKRLLDAWYNEYGTESLQEINAGELANIEAELKDRLPLTTTHQIKPLWPRIAAAASILLLLGAGSYFVFRPKPQQFAQVVKKDFLPGHNQATLTLANGQQIVITKNLTGQLATQGQTVINATHNNIVYNTTSENRSVSYNTLRTARGEQSPSPLILADGTKVWLNAESSITFPTAFPGKERIVKVAGEAYFEVKHNAAQPFKVQTEKQTIEDIGTAFDVNAYSDEPVVKTTLLQGAVKVSAGNQSVILQPGDQAQNLKITHDVDLDGAIAWKNDLFQFSGSDVKEAMRQFARWYDVDVTYEGEMPDVAFGGKISRKVKASEVFEALKRYHLNFKIEGKKVIVTKQ